MSETSQNGLQITQTVLCLLTACLILIPVGIVIVKVNKRIPKSFILNIFLYTLGIGLRAIIAYE